MPSQSQRETTIRFRQNLIMENSDMKEIMENSDMREFMLAWRKSMLTEINKCVIGSPRHDIAVIFYLRADEWLLRDNTKRKLYFYTHR